MPITPAAGWQIDPNNPNGVIPIGSQTTPQQTTLAQDQAKAANQGKPGYDVFGNPTTPTVNPTVLSSGNVQDKYQPDLQNKLDLYKNQGQIVGADNMVRDTSGNLVAAPQGTQPDQNGQYNVGGFIYGAPPSINGTNYDQESFDRTINMYNKVKAQTDPQTKAILDNITNTYQNLIQQMQDSNTRNQASVNQSLLMAGTSRYAQTNSEGIINGTVQNGIMKIAQLENEKQSKILAAQQAADSQDWQLVGKILQGADSAKAEQQKAAQEVSQNLAKHYQDLIDQQDQATKDSAIQQQISSGTTDPAQILKNLQSSGVTNIDLKDIKDTLDTLNPYQKDILQLVGTASKNGAPADVLKAISGSKNLTDAYTAAGAYTQDPTSNIGMYNAYAARAKAAGKTPIPPEDFIAHQKYLDAYNTTLAQEKAKKTLGGDGTSSTGSFTSKEQFPAPLRPYSRQSANGTWYVDLSAISANERSKLISQAGDTPVITDKNQAADLVNIKDAMSKLKTAGNVMRDLTSASALSRDLGGAGLSYLQAAAQTDPRKAAASALNDSALDMLKALSGVQGFRGNQTAIEQIRDSMPKITDTQDVAAQKLSYIAQQIQDREEATLGTRGTVDNTTFVLRTEDQAKSAIVDYGNKHQDARENIKNIMGSTNPDTGQPYTYLDAAQILGIDIPALGVTSSTGYTLPSSSWNPQK